MAFNAYLIFHKSVRKEKAQGICGESTSEPEKGVPKGHLEISDYAFGVSMPTTTSRSDGGGATVGRANFDIFSCTKSIDTATPFLVQYCCTGKNIPSIVLHLYRQGSGTDVEASGTVKYAVVVFQNCVITKVGVQGSGEELPKESLEFNYGYCEYIYQETKKSDGTKVGNPIPFGWSTVTNTAKPSGQKFTDFEPADAKEKD
jgi:type VI secretion system secreted protein Hcp